MLKYNLSEDILERYIFSPEFRNIVNSQGRVWEFKLSDYKTLVNISFLRGVHIVYLCICPRVADVSDLSTGQTLTLWTMDRVTDVSSRDSVKPQNYRCALVIKIIYTI